MNKQVRTLLLLSCTLAAPFSQGQTYSLTQNSWSAVLASAQPGDILLLEDSATPWAGKIISGLHGTPAQPITLTAQTPLGVTLTGSDPQTPALQIEQSSNLIIRGLQLQNSNGMNGDTDYSPQAREWAKEGIVISESDNITLEGNLFDDIATRGLSAQDTNNLYLHHNLFIDVGDDSASSGITLEAGNTHWRIKDNLFATNVNAIATTGPGTGGIIDSNLIVFNRHGSGITLSSHLAAGTEVPASTVHRNTLYAGKTQHSGLNVTGSSQFISIRENVIYEAGQQAALAIEGRCAADEETGTGCRSDVSRHIIYNNWLINRRGGEAPGIALAETSSSQGDPERATLSQISLSDNRVLGYSPSLSSWDTSRPETLTLTGNQLYTASTQADTSNTNWLPDNSLDSLTQADALGLSQREQSLVDSLAHDYSFTKQILRKALNKGDIGYPFIRQCLTSDDHLAMTAADAGLATGLSAGLMFYKGDIDALGLGALYAIALKSSHDTARAGKIIFRTLFTNPGEYQLYARLKCINDCSLGDSLYTPTGFDTALDKADHYQVSEPGITADYQWFNLGSYSPDAGRYNSFVLGLRDGYLMIDSLVFHKTTGLENSPATLDQLALQRLTDKDNPEACQ